MSNIFILKKLNDNGTEITVSPGKPYWEEPHIQLELKDMALGTSKGVTFRLYSLLTPELFDLTSAVFVKFDFSEAYTHFRNYRYDTDFENSLRKFIKITLSVGNLNSSSVSNQSLEISSDFHANKGEPIIGFILTKDNTIYERLRNNPDITNMFLVLPFLPKNGEFIPFRIGVQIPSKFEEDFLGKAGGFPVKQGEFKSPFTVHEIFSNIAKLQKTYIANTPAKNKYIKEIGPLPFDFSEISDEELSVNLITALATNLAQRNLFLRAGEYVFESSWSNKPTLIPGGTNYLDPTNPVNYESNGMPTEYRIIPSPGISDIPPSSVQRPVHEFLEVLALILMDFAVGYKQRNAVENSIYNDLFTKYLNTSSQMLNNLNSFLFVDSNLSLFDSFSGTYDSTLPSYIVGLYKQVSELTVLLIQALAELDNVSPSTLPTYYEYVPDVCLESYYLGNPISPECESFERNLVHSIKSYTNSSWLLLLPEEIPETLLTLWFTYQSVKHNENLNAEERTRFLNSSQRFVNKITYLSKWINQNILNRVGIINKTAASGNAEEFLNGASVEDLYKTALLFDFVDQVLDLNDTGTEQFFHYYNKFAFHKGIHNNTQIKIWNDSPTVGELTDNIEGVVSDFDAKRQAFQSLTSAYSKKQAEKLISLKMSAAPIM